jgi:hypothetical protein
MAASYVYNKELENGIFIYPAGLKLYMTIGGDEVEVLDGTQGVTVISVSSPIFKTDDTYNAPSYRIGEYAGECYIQNFHRE